MTRLLITTISLFFFVLPTQAAKNLTWDSPEKLRMRGQVYFNATRSAQGEKYLLTQQLSNIKLYSDFIFTPETELHTLLIYNSAPTPITPELYFDEAYLALTKSTLLPHYYMHIGKKWLPFGIYKNDLIYKPLSKALGQTNAYNITLGYDHKYYANIALFLMKSPTSANLPGHNINFGLHDEYENFTYDIGASYISSSAESELYQYNKGFGGFLGERIHSRVPGFATYTNLNYKNISTYITYVTAIHAFKPNELSYQNHGAKPAALSIQSAYHLHTNFVKADIIGLYDQSFQALALQLPKRRLGMGINIFPNRHTEIQFEYYKDYAYKNSVTASGLNYAMTGRSKVTDTYALQLIVNF